MINKKVNRKALARAFAKASDRLDDAIRTQDLTKVHNAVIEGGAGGYCPNEEQSNAIRMLEKIEAEKQRREKKEKRNVRN